ncbi:MAG: hypothetical protein ACRDIB_13340 [Ardenticatenaceae bacterium]
MSVLENSRIAFAHPAEAEFAHLLDYYGIEWLYEPHTFPLAWDEDGTIREAFSPDFYLPQQELYIELTTLRPRLHSRKNRKVRRMHELYPHVNVKLLKRGDLHTLMLKYGLEDEASKLQGGEAQEREA